MKNELTVDQIENAFPENDVARNSVMYDNDDGYIKVSAQWLHDFARGIHASGSNVIADAPQDIECRDSEVIRLRLRAVDSAGFWLTAELIKLPGDEVVDRDMVLELCTQWRMKRDAAIAAQPSKLYKQV